MLKAKIGGKIFLGLSDENMKRLKDDQPIKFSLKELGMEDVDVVIFNGRTEESMKDELIKGVNKQQ